MSRALDHLYRCLRPLLFRLDAERSHHLTLNLLQVAYRLGLLRRRQLPQPDDQWRIMGLKLSNPVGLAAGLDKNGRYIDALGALGFGFIEIGTVTPRPQIGHDRPRLFRIPAQKAVLNRMGFNNDGIDAVMQRVRQRRFRGVLGINIGKNADTPIEQAEDDYVLCLRKAYAHVDYISVNISSPNTKQLRCLQSAEALRGLLSTLKKEQQQQLAETKRYVPLAVKIAPDLQPESIAEIAKIVQETEIDGVIATNTTVCKESLRLGPLAKEAGGVSGLPVQTSSNAVLEQLKPLLAPTGITLIGVGGIMSPGDARRKQELGADVIQLYSGLVYHGPGLIQACIRALSPNDAA